MRRAHPDVDITVIERGPYTSYAMCGIPYSAWIRFAERLDAEGIELADGQTAELCLAIDAWVGAPPSGVAALTAPASLVGLSSTVETTSPRALIQLATRRLDLARKDGNRKVICYATPAHGLQFWRGD